MKLKINLQEPAHLDGDLYRAVWNLNRLQGRKRDAHFVRSYASGAVKCQAEMDFRNAKRLISALMTKYKDIFN